MTAPCARPAGRRRVLALLGGAALALGGPAALLGPAGPAGAASPCGASVNPIACENQQPGTPASVWDISGAGDQTIQGFATDISVNAGSTISFKIKTNARAYRIDVYRLGWYGGNGARKVASVTPSAALPQSQPACATNSTTRLYDCGTWAVSASWAVPSSAVSGVYLADLTRTDTGGMSQISFVVRNDASTSDIVYQTSDPTWQAYNRYGGADFYTGSSTSMWDSASRARAISYNRPFLTRDDNSGQDFLFSNEYPTIRFLERNGYDLTYISGVDTDRYGATLLGHHKVFLSVGHDEYWSQQQRTNVEKARDAGVNLMYLSGNEVYWHTRFAASIDGRNTAYRTLVCYKNTWDDAPSDPVESTATWRDPRFAGPPGGANPENGLTGTEYYANAVDLTLTVGRAEGRLRIWRGTGLASMTSASTALAPHTVGYESDEDRDNGFRPAGLIDMSTTTGPTDQELTDFGTTTTPGTTTHHITLYRASSGALVFSAGTIQWGWGLDASHDGTSSPADSRMQQATVNMLADMHAAATTLQSGLAAASASTDTTAPTTAITSPAAGSTVTDGSTLTVSGTASDSGGGVVAGVEVSLDGGASWHPATGTTSWSYRGVVHGAGALSIRARATDDSANLQASPAAVSVTATCPCTLFGSTVPGTTPDSGPSSTSPAVADSGDGSANELGTAFTSTVDGRVTGVRFYKSAANTGTHTGTLWSAGGAVLATGTFTGESASGWQTLTFGTPVAITAGSTYVASYWDPNGHYAVQPNFFWYRPYAAGPLQAPPNTPANASVNGLYAGAHAFPTDSYQGSNYFVDPVFTTGGTSGGGGGTTGPTVTAQTPAPGATGVPTSVAPTAVFSSAVTASSIRFTLTSSAGVSVAGSTGYDSTSRTATFTPTAALAAGTRYTATVSATGTGGTPMSAPAGWSFTTASSATGATCPCTIHGAAWTPATASDPDTNSVELGVRFHADTDGVVTGLRFYKGPNDTGTHVGTLWTSGGTALASVTFAGESASGWQSATFASPVSVTAGTTYVASYHAPNGGYASDGGALATAGIDNFPLHVPAQGAVYRYGSTSAFPATTSSDDYGVDVIFTVPSSVVPTVSSTSPAAGATGVDPAAAVSATFTTSVAQGSASVTVTGPGGTTVAGVTSLNGTQNVVTFRPSSPLATGTAYSVTVSGARSLAGTAQQGSTTFSFTTGSGSSGGGGGSSNCPCTLFGSATPVTADSGDTSAVTLGLRFTPSVDGWVTGVRFYKASANTGTHVGTLWSASGTKLASVTFSGETGSGWQSASFASAVQVSAGSTYVVSYLAPAGHYAEDDNVFTSPVTSGPLTAPATGNGVYVYGTTTAFPNQTWQSANYWVDLVFTTTRPA